MNALAEKLSIMSPEHRLYVLQRLPTHLAEAQQKERLHQLLTTFGFLQAKEDELGPQPLIEDYEPCADEDLRIIQNIIRRSAHVLAQDKTKFAGQLLGHL